VITATNSYVYLAIHATLFCVRRGVSVERLPLPGPVLRIVVPCGGFNNWAVIQCDNEVLAIAHRGTENRVETIDESTAGKVCGITRDGRLVLDDGKRLEIYARRGGHFHRASVVHHRVHSPIGILAAREPGQVLIVCRDGEIALLNIGL
jgi:hypothetical protein